MKHYNVRYTNSKTNRSGLSNASPMSHSEACTFKSKLRDHAGVSYVLEEVKDSLVIDCGLVKVVDLTNGVRVKREVLDNAPWWGVYVESPVTESGYVLQAEYKTLELAINDAMQWGA